MADAKVIVSAENRLKQGLDDARKDLLGIAIRMFEAAK